MHWRENTPPAERTWLHSVDNVHGLTPGSRCCSDDAYTPIRACGFHSSLANLRRKKINERGINVYAPKKWAEFCSPHLCVGF